MQNEPSRDLLTFTVLRMRTLAVRSSQMGQARRRITGPT